MITLANKNLRAERQTGGEAGASFYLFNQRLDSRVTVFDRVDTTNSGQSSILEGQDGGIFRLVNPNGPPSARFWQSLIGNLRIGELYSIGYDPLNGAYVAGAQDDASQELVPGDPDRFQSVGGGDGNSSAAGLDRADVPAQPLCRAEEVERDAPRRQAVERALVRVPDNRHHCGVRLEVCAKRARPPGGRGAEVPFVRVADPRRLRERQPHRGQRG